MKAHILFLGPADSPLLDWLFDQGERITITSEKITPNYITENQFDFLISYGYRHFLKTEILDLFPNRAINLHISYLPFNRGADPNFWSFLEGTPKGVTIHYLDPGVDTGDIIVRKQVVFDDLSTETLGSCYQRLHQEIQTLFYENWAAIKAGKSERQVQFGEGTAHRMKDKEPYLHLLEKDNWNTKVSVLVEFGKRLMP